MRISDWSSDVCSSDLLRSRRWGIVKRLPESIVTFRIEHKQALVEQHIHSLPAGALDHEFRARLTPDRRSILNELSGPRFDPHVSTALGIGLRGNLRTVHRRASWGLGRVAQSICPWPNTVRRHTKI